jgi:hypothetical protein
VWRTPDLRCSYQPIRVPPCRGACLSSGSGAASHLTVVLGAWLIFGTMAFAVLALVLLGRDIGIGSAAFSAFMLAISAALVWKAARNYLARGKTDEKNDRYTGRRED